jgi:hypothetical protein
LENNDYDVKIEYPQSWNVREGDIEPGDFNIQIAIFYDILNNTNNFLIM